MITKKTLKLFGVSLILSALPLTALAVPQLPHIFYGAITINGSPAPVGTIIIAKVGGVEKGRITTNTAGAYGGPGAYDGKLIVQGDNLSGPITFTVSGVSGTPTASFESGKVEQLDLSFTISQVEVTPSGLANLLNNGTFSVAGPNTSASSINITQPTLLNVGSNSVTLPQGVNITKVGGGNFDATALTAAEVSASSLSGLGTGKVVKGALQWGIASLGLGFSKAINIQIYVGADLNGQTLDVVRSTSVSSGWTNDGIVAPATCVVASGYCSFSATKASYYAASQTTTTTTTTTTTSSGGGGGGGGGGGSVTTTTTTITLSAAAQKVDANKDNKIDVLDFNTLMVNWGKTTINNVADFNGDSKVDIFDFNLLMINWTK